MADVLHGIEEDVPFDFGAADDLIATADLAASAVTGQIGSRSGYVSTAMDDFRGHFSRLFQDNWRTGRADAYELADRLREVATGARRLKEEARKEQQRRETARQWKREQDDRNLWDRGVDALFGEDAPPVGPAASPVTIPVSAPRSAPRQTPSPGGGGSGGGTSSARPSDLRTFATGAGGLDDGLAPKLSRLRSDASRFTSTCHWGRLDASGVVSGFDRWIDANRNDARWARVVADAFAAAGGEGNVSTLADSALLASLQAAGVDATRQDLTIDPPTAYGHPPTTGYSDDPVNTSTGNFLESEADLAFGGGAESLGFSRTYNSLDSLAGGAVTVLGPGWSSWCDAGMVLDDGAARFTLPDGRQVQFPRLGTGWGRAVGENLWLARTDHGLRVTGNAGEWWELTGSGRLLALGAGPGTTVRLEWDDDLLLRMSHERGRSIELSYDTPVPGVLRLVGLTGSDGREVRYLYDDRARLIACTTDLGMRRYRWNDDGVVDAVYGSTGAAEVENEYDARGRVTRQLSAHGRVTRYAYLPGRVTVVSDDDGTRANTWVADQRGRLVGVIDADDRRQSTSYDPHGNVVLVTERDGSATVRMHDDRGRLVRWTTPEGADFTQTWDELDRVTGLSVAASADAEPATTTFSYDADERNPATLTDPEGGVTRMTWARGLLTEVVDPTGVVVRFEHDRFGDLVAVADALGHTARLERDQAGRVVAAITPSGHRTTYAYDKVRGLLARRTDPGGGTWRFEHDAGGRLKATVDPQGGRTEIERSRAGDATRTIDPLGRALVRRFDDLGNLAEVELPDGATWRFAHDAMSRLRETTDPTGAVTTHDYDATGQLVSTTGPGGQTSTVTRDRRAGTSRLETGTREAGVVASGLQVDRLGRLVASTRPDGSSVLTRYDRCGRPVELVDALGNVTSVRRDAAGRPTTVVKAGGGEISYEYDACGRPAVVVDEVGGRTTFEYDADARVVAQVSPAGDRTTWDFDADGRVVKRRVPGFGTTLVSYDAVGRVAESRDPQFGHRRYRYDAAGQLVEAIDGNGGSTRWDYDLNGRAVAITDATGGVVRREFDAMNRCVAETDALGRTTRGAYDGAGRLVWQEDPDGIRTEWTHDARGEVETVTVDGYVVARFHRDPAGRTLRVDDHTRGVGRAVVHRLEWDACGRLVSRTRDDRGLSWSYDADGRRTRRTGPDGSEVDYHRDAAGRVIAIDHAATGRAVFERDAAGRVVTAHAGGTTQTWTYGDGFVATHTVTATDGTGQRTSRSVVDRDETGRVVTVARDGVATGLTFDAACQLVAARVGESVTSYRYDPAGRLVEESADGEVRSLAYDAAGQLTTSTDAEGREVRYSYDGRGRRTHVAASDGSSRDLVWDRSGWLAQVVDTGADGSTRTVTTAVDALGELSRVDDAEVFFDSADTFAPAPAQVGDQSVVAAGSLVGVGPEWRVPGWRTARADAGDPWGSTAERTVDPGAATGVSVGASGGLAISGLEWLGARVYDPADRSFLSVDPVDPVPGSGWAGNPYSYAGNDPVHASDPTGRSPVTDAELAAYAAAHQGALAAAGDWVKGNWEYLAGGAMVIAGGVLMATGVGGPAGMMLISAGADVIIQKATTGGVNWGQVAISGAFGAWGGVGAAARMGVSTVAGRTIVGGMISGASGGAVSSAYGYATGPGPHTPGGFLQATATGGTIGGVTGGAGGVFGHGVNNFRAGRYLDDVTPTPLTDAQEARRLLGNPGDTVVLGRQHDTAVAAGWDGHTVLQSDRWSLNLNDEFIQGTIDYQRPVYLASNPEGNLIQDAGEYAGQPTIFARELDQLDQAGYVRDGDYMYPPGHR